MKARNHENKRRLTVHDLLADFRNKLGGMQTVLDIIKHYNITSSKHDSLFQGAIDVARNIISEIKNDKYLDKFDANIERHEIDLDVLKLIANEEDLPLSDNIINIVHKSLNQFKRL